jgi:peptide/nickel transport system permease protein
MFNDRSGALAPDASLYRRRLPLPRGLSTTATLAASILGLVALVSILAPLVAPADPNALNLTDGLQGPSWAHLLGEDASGRDILSRLIWGARLSLLGPSTVVGLAVVVGVPLGLFAGWRGGLIDGIASRVTDALLAFPPLLLAIVIAAAFGAGFRTAIVAIAITYVPVLTRVVRGLVLVEREQTYVEALRSQGFPATVIASRHVLLNVLPRVGVQVALSFGYALIDLAALSFLGLGTQPPTSDWGSMLSEGRTSLLLDPTEVVVVAVTIALVVVFVNALADSLMSWTEARGA